MSEFFGPHGTRDFTVSIPESGFLEDRAARVEFPLLATNLVKNRFFHRAKGIEVLNFDFGAELAAALWSEGDIRVTPKTAFFHVAITHFDVLQEGVEIP